MSEKVIFINYKLPVDKLSNLDLSARVINTINPHSYVIAKKDSIFKKALQDSDILLPDGIGIVKAVKFLKNKKIDKIAGSDLHIYMLKQANTEKLKVFYLGASQPTLQIIEDKLRIEFPNITVKSYSPPFKQVFSVDDTQQMIEQVNVFAPDILFVGMTAPKQEKWVYKNNDRLNAKTICCIGAVFDFYAETIKRPPKWVIKIGLEWFGRFIKEPRRMWRRNLISTPAFLFDVIKAKFIRNK